MAAGAMTVCVGVDIASVDADLDLLSKTIETSPRLVAALEQLGELDTHLRKVQVPTGLPVHMCGLLYRLEWSAPMRELVSAVRAGDFDDE